MLPEKQAKVFDVAKGCPVKVFQKELRHAENPRYIGDGKFLCIRCACLLWAKSDLLIFHAFFHNGHFARVAAACIGALPTFPEPLDRIRRKAARML